jgi:hypothetical protein
MQFSMRHLRPWFEYHLEKRTWHKTRLS